MGTYSLTCNVLVGNHKNIFNDARVPWSEYRYYDPKTVGLDFDGMISDIKVSLNHPKLWDIHGVSNFLSCWPVFQCLLFILMLRI